MNGIGEEEQSDNLFEKLKQQNKKIKNLELMLDEERKKAQLLANLNAELNIKLECHTFDQQQSKIEYDSLQQQSSRNDLDEKNDEIDKLNKQINDLEWSLGEYKQWLNDANTSIII
ncbi:hypothetical protein WUBG_15591 [Wuchereria bancrofti]|uniref:Uncharacterized protein n=1 Tax=Wuchereria bancrofti TaxID=6293 RepID=J9DUW6_WUCBA|nr:hypothetical protein WUBG_15591 [Wuchereria bancrofti]